MPTCCQGYGHLTLGRTRSEQQQGRQRKAHTPYVSSESQSQQIARW